MNTVYFIWTLLTHYFLYLICIWEISTQLDLGSNFLKELLNNPLTLLRKPMIGRGKISPKRKKFFQYLHSRPCGLPSTALRIALISPMYFIILLHPTDSKENGSLTVT